MRLIKTATNPHTGFKYRILYDSRNSQWLIQGQTPNGKERAVFAWFHDIKDAQRHLKKLAYCRVFRHARRALWEARVESPTIYNTL